MATYDSQSYNGRYIRLTVTESDQDPKNNRSKVNWTVTVNGANGAWYSSTVYLAINGIELINTSWIDPPQGSFPMVNGTSKSGFFWVKHGSDGSKSVSITFNTAIYYRAAEAHGGTFDLSTLDRVAPEITAGEPSDIDVGGFKIQVSSNEDCSAWGYQIKKENGSYGEWHYAPPMDARRHTFTITGLETNTSYVIKLAGKKDVNDIWGYANEVTVKTQGASVIKSVTATAFGSASTIIWDVLDASFKFELSFEINGVEQDAILFQNVEIGELTASYNIPLEWIAGYPNDNEGDITYRLKTFDENGNQVGSDSVETVTVSIPDTQQPVIDEVQISEGTASGFGVFAKTLSTVRTQITDHPSLGASIVRRTVKVENTTYEANSLGVAESQILTTYGTIEVQISTVDSRGRTATALRTITVYNYFEPTISVKVDVAGTTLEARISGQIASVNNLNAKRMVLTCTKTSDGTRTGTKTINPLSGYEFNETWILTVPDVGSETYEIEAIVYDSRTEKIAKQQTGQVCLSRLGGGKGAAFFGEAWRTGFEVNGKSYLKEELEVVGIDHTVNNQEYMDLAAGLAKDFDTSSQYVPGDFVERNGDIYLCIAPHQGAWNTAHFENYGEELQNNAIAGIAVAGLAAAGNYATHTMRILYLLQNLRTNPLIPQMPPNPYPVGAIYLSVDSTDPGTLFGGTWVRIKDTFLLAAGDDYAAGDTGGEAEHTLTTDEMPAHTHGNKKLSGSLTAYTWATGSASGIVSKQTPHQNMDMSGGNTIGHNSYTINASHEHDSVGSGQAHNNMPPYIAVYMWRRTA